jgi:UDP-N-acetylmuramyl pentapeptide synthase
MAPDQVLEVGDRTAALDVLRPRLREGDVVLVKASRGSALDLLVDELRRERGTDGPAVASAPPSGPGAG